MKTALFVDFDNVYTGLRKLDPAFAERFGRQPSRWIDWMHRHLPNPDHVAPDARRRMLVRRVYLNPQVYQGYRSSFNHAGFEIIDCPAMTTQGKTSTDIHMVLDIVELLQHEVHYDEFIVFSADADFTPVLRKLRRFDRRTTVLAVGFPSAAYRASADLLIDPDVFVREAMGFDDPSLDEMPEGRVLSAALGALPAALPTAAPAVEVVEGVGTLSVNLPPPAFDLALITQRLRDEVAASELPVPCARLALRLGQEFPGLAPDWCGYLSFRRFAESLSLLPLVFDWSNSGGYLLDPSRHELKPLSFSPQLPDNGWGLDRATMNLIRQVHEATGVPLLSPRDFRGLFMAIELDVGQHPFQLGETGKRVRDICREAGLSISREDVNWVLRGLLLSGHEFGQGCDDLRTMSYRLVGNLLNLCRREQVIMDETGPPALHRWVSGRVQDEAGPGR